MTSGAEGTAGVHLDHQPIGMLRRDLQPGRQDQQPRTDRIGLPMLFPAEAPILVGHIVPVPIGQAESKGLRQRLQAGDQLPPLRPRPLRLREPDQQRLAIRRFRSMLHRMAMQPQIRQFPHQRLLQLRRTRECETPPHQSVTGCASWMPSMAVIVCSRSAGIGSSMLSTITASPRTILRPTCMEAMLTLCSPSREPR